MYVLPVKDTDESVACLVLDPSRGYKWNGQNDNPVKAAMVLAANSAAVADVGVTRIAVESREEYGRMSYVMAATVED